MFICGDNMDVSVVIPYFNSKTTILVALESLNNQTVKPNEVILVDDYSNHENSLEFLKDYHFDFRLKIIHHELNLGAATARNTGVLNAQGFYVAFLDSDDAWVENKLELQLNSMKKNFELDYLYSNYSEKLPVKNVTNPEIRDVNIFDVFKKNLSPVTLIAKRSSIILFDSRLRRCDDFKLSIEALLNGQKIGFLNFYSSYGFKKAIGESGLTGSIVKMSLSFIYANLLLIIEYPSFFLWGSAFIIFELIKFPFRFIRTQIL